MNLFLTSCCKYKIYNELEPIGILTTLEYHNRVVEYMVFKGNFKDIEFKLCSDKCRFIIGSIENKLGE